MPEFKTTAKGVSEPFVKRTAETVDILGTSYDVHFTKGEDGKGWQAFAAADLSAVSAPGKTLDGAVLALRGHLTDLAEADAMDDKTESVESAADDIESVEAAPVAESVESTISDSEAADMIAKAVGNARRAYTGRAADAGHYASVAVAAVAEMSERGNQSERSLRLYDYGAKLAGHYSAKTGGSGTALTDAQRSRAHKKFGKVCGELVD